MNKQNIIDMIHFDTWYSGITGELNLRASLLLTVDLPADFNDTREQRNILKEKATKQLLKDLYGDE